MQSASDIISSAYVNELNSRLVTPNLANKYSQIFPIMGPGVWLSFTQGHSRNDFQPLTQQLTDKDLVYAPCDALRQYNVNVNTINELKSRVSSRSMFVMHVFVWAEGVLDPFQNKLSCGSLSTYMITWFNF
jgi:hypothetical protein